MKGTDDGRPTDVGRVGEPVESELGTRCLDYELPADAVAQEPLARRDAARLLVDHGPGRAPAHRTVADLADLVRPGDVVVVNDTRVLPARLRLRKATGGAVEVLLLQPCADGGWEALVKPGRRVPDGTALHGPEGIVCRVTADLGDGRRRVVLAGAEDDLALLQRIGEVPLPPYIDRPLHDPDRYQTVYARSPGSVAAPTAGLHLTEAVLDRCRGAGALVEAVDLSVGLGTFRPIASERVADHVMHLERFGVPEATWETVAGATRVVAVGTTVVRALETVAATGQLEGTTDLFIRRPYRFQVVDVLLTNFHLPRSSLLVLVDAFVGPRWHELYETALGAGYRFLSFGDAMLIERADHHR